MGSQDKTERIYEATLHSRPASFGEIMIEAGISPRRSDFVRENLTDMVNRGLVAVLDSGKFTAIRRGIEYRETKDVVAEVFCG